jgi:kynurenine formamidase
MTATGLDTTQSIELGAGAKFCDDYVTMPLQAGTQWDSLAHFLYGGQLYNGYPASSVDSGGAHVNSIDKVHGDFVSRGVLLDVARAKHVDCLDSTYSITSADLEAAEVTQGVRVEEGDILMVRTGLMSTYVETGRWKAFHGFQPGLHYRALEWIHERRIAAVAADNSSVECLADVMPGVRLPLHMVAIRDMGLSLGELWFLEELAAECAADRVFECLLVAQALPITGAVGSPVNPIALR